MATHNGRQAARGYSSLSVVTNPQAEGPPPNPPFSFPAAEPYKDSPPPSRMNGRRPMSAVEGSAQAYHPASKMNRANRKVALPEFSFNPGAALPSDPNTSMPSPPLSPQLPKVFIPEGKPKGHGHRRGGSEFIGGRLREGNSIAVINGSPTKPESGHDLHPFCPPRRGHRRGISSTLSTSDLSLLPLPGQGFSPKSGSAPNSPTNFEHTPIDSASRILAENIEPLPAQADEDVIMDSPEANEEEIDSPPKSSSRARVGFSDTLEFIPRPLSLVSTDTSSTVTARPGHGVSDSISSIITSCSPGPDIIAPARSPPRNINFSRPSTAGAVLDRVSTNQSNDLNTSSLRRNSIPTLLDMANSAPATNATPSPTKSAKRWSFFGLEPFSSQPVSQRQRPHSSYSGETSNRNTSVNSSDNDSESQTESVEEKCTHIGDKKRSKKRKMVKGWAGSILTRKAKDKRSKYSVRPPTPPPAELHQEEEDDHHHENISPLTQTTPIVTVTDSDDFQWPTRPREEISSPVIDLDAALGPFNTPLLSNPEWEAAQRAVENESRRRLHSAQGMRGFSGPGMHYHRRAESAPDLPPFDSTPSCASRFGSTSTMADVFEEDEEEEGREDKRRVVEPEPTVEEEPDGEITPPATLTEPLRDGARIFRRRSSGLSDREPSSIGSIRAQRSGTSLHDSVIMEEQDSRPATGRGSSFGPDQSPKMFPSYPRGSEVSAPFDSNASMAPPHISTPLSPHSASFASSPRSPMSADTQRLSTAPSSVNEEHSFQSLLLGEPGPEVRLSVDCDVPSLTSSTTSTTRESSHVPHARMSQPTLRETRPLSVSSAAFGRRRASLVSLSRLISTSHGERSKLSIEVSMEAEGNEAHKSKSKAKRLGRFVQFWKAKNTSVS